MGRIYHTAHKRAKFRNIVRNLVTELIIYGHIKVTKRKYQAVKENFDQLINWAKKGTLHDYRQIFKVIRKNSQTAQKEYAFSKLKKIAQTYSQDHSGYLKVYKLGVRKGDNAPFYYLVLK